MAIIIDIVEGIKSGAGKFSYIDEIGGVLYAMREDGRVDHFAPGGLNISSDEAFQPFFAKYLGCSQPGPALVSVHEYRSRPF